MPNTFIVLIQMGRAILLMPSQKFVQHAGA